MSEFDEWAHKNLNPPPTHILAYEAWRLDVYNPAKVAYKQGLLDAAAMIPHTWLDALLSGPDAVAISFNGPVTEELLRRIKERIRQKAEELK